MVTSNVFPIRIGHPVFSNASKERAVAQFPDSPPRSSIRTEISDCFSGNSARVERLRILSFLLNLSFLMKTKEKQEIMKTKAMKRNTKFRRFFFEIISVNSHIKFGYDNTHLNLNGSLYFIFFCKGTKFRNTQTAIYTLRDFLQQFF